MQTTTAHQLQATGLHLQRGGRTLARDFSLALDTGEIVGLRGPSGSGKTTLLRGVAGLIECGDGALSLDGRPAGSYSWPGFRSRVTCVNQQPALREGSVRENLERPFQYGCRVVPFPHETARDLLARFELPDDVWNAAATELSVGEQQRVALIRALITEPWFLLLDEPTSALDPGTAGLVMDCLRESADEGAFGVLIVSHDIERAERYADRTIEFPGGGD